MTCLRYPHGRRGAVPTPEAREHLRLAREIILPKAGDRRRRTWALHCAHVVNVESRGAVHASYAGVVLQRYIDLLGAKIMADAPPLPRTGRGLSLDVYQAASDLALSLLPVAAGSGAGR